MEKTELREQFFAEALRDPYAHMITRMCSDAWACGYEQALRDHGLVQARMSESHDERRTRALEWITDDRRRAEAEMVIAMARVGSLVPHPVSGTAG